ncbi:MAG TPA: sigma-54 dependent transcriptional regulator [Polyangiaceae bacterium]|nr:sigma-54 dependent transcriptional regulator [Polyangiaceae bacterium]
MRTHPSTGTVLVVEDDEQALRAVRALLAAYGFKAICASSGAEAMQLLELQANDIDCVLTDLYMPGVSGMDLLMHIRQVHPELPVVVATGHADVPSAVTAIREGAFDFQLKPLTPDTLTLALGRAIEHRRLKDRNRYLEQRLEVSQRFRGIIGSSPAMRHVFELVANVAAAEATVLITGESGTGKELVARSLHDHSPRAARGFVAINCGALTETLLESELFGHERGAFTGADSKRRGLFEEANGGTLFLDEVGELTPSTQVRLLRVLQERCVRPVGSNQARPIDVRVLAATNRDLQKEVREKRFREDLFYRLNVVSIELPPLRARGEDMLLIAHHLLGKHGSRLGKPGLRFSPEALEAMTAYEFPGNIRELENAIERAVIMTVDSVVELSALPSQFRPAVSRSRFRPALDLPFTEARNRFERGYLDQVLEETGGNLSAAARKSGMDRSNFRRLLERHGVRSAS